MCARKFLTFYLISLIIIELCNGLPVNTTEDEDKVTPSSSQPCPCSDQPEGVMMPHPSDCRAYYICLGSSNVAYSRCGAGDQFFHPYLRSCVQRSKYAFFVPNIIETKDLCRFNPVFRSPASENFDNCHITSDEHAPESDSSEDTAANSVHGLFTTAVPVIDYSLEHHWMKNLITSVPSNDTLETTTSEPHFSTTTEVPPTTTPEMYSPAEVLTSSSPTVDCKMTKMVIHHFPGPCKADITCENGASFTVNNCLNTLTFISQLTPASN